MTPDQRFTLILVAIGTGFTILSAILTVAWRSIKGGITSQVKTQNDIRRLVQDTNTIGRNLDRHIQWHLDRGNGRR